MGVHVAAPAPDSRARIVTAATAEFAAHGYDATTVDEIARRAGLNKAMIYYHFDDKLGLYVEILRDVLGSLGARTREVVESAATPDAKVGAFVDALNAEADARPEFPFLMMREIADGARHLDADTLRLMTAIVGNLGDILGQGVKTGIFHATNPFLTYFTLMSPVIFFRVSAPVRQALARERLAPQTVFDRDTFVGYVKAGALAVLNAGARKPLTMSLPAAPSPRRRTPRTGVRT